MNEFLAVAVIACILAALVGYAIGYFVGLRRHAWQLASATREAAELRQLTTIEPLTTDQPHRHRFNKQPARTEDGWSYWTCVLCPQEYATRATRIKPEAGIV